MLVNLILVANLTEVFSLDCYNFLILLDDDAFVDETRIIVTFSCLCMFIGGV